MRPGEVAVHRTPPESRAEPPMLFAFSITITLAPRCAAKPAADNPAMPAPRTSRSHSRDSDSVITATLSESRLALQEHHARLAGHRVYLTQSTRFVHAQRAVPAIAQVAPDDRD